MTKQNVVVPEAMPIVVAAASVPGSSPLFPYRPPRSGGAIRRKPLIQLDLGQEAGGGGGRINSWLESMKASSPTQAKAAAALAGAPSVAALDDLTNWMIQHPSALSMFEEITNASMGKQIVMFLDYDGTLSPIVDNPDQAFMSKTMRAAVKDVARYFPTAIVSGRCRDKVYKFVRLAELYYAGSHGMDIRGPARGPKNTKSKTEAVLFQPASEFLPMIEEVYKALVERTKSIPGSNVENNKFCVSVHFRCVDEKSWSGLAEQVRSVMKEYPQLRLSQGRKVLEIRSSIK